MARARHVPESRGSCREALCRGCRLPLIDGLGSLPPLTHLTEEERIRHDAAEVAYRLPIPTVASSKAVLRSSGSPMPSEVQSRRSPAKGSGRSRPP